MQRLRAVVSFADGHMEVHHWLDNRTLPQIVSGNYIGHNLSAAGNADFAWIAAHTTSQK